MTDQTPLTQSKSSDKDSKRRSGLLGLQKLRRASTEAVRRWSTSSVPILSPRHTVSRYDRPVLHTRRHREDTRESSGSRPSGLTVVKTRNNDAVVSNKKIRQPPIETFCAMPSSGTSHRTPTLLKTKNPVLLTVLPPSARHSKVDAPPNSPTAATKPVLDAGESQEDMTNYNSEQSNPENTDYHFTTSVLGKFAGPPDGVPTIDTTRDPTPATPQFKQVRWSISEEQLATSMWPIYDRAMAQAASILGADENAVHGATVEYPHQACTKSRSLLDHTVLMARPSFDLRRADSQDEKDKGPSGGHRSSTDSGLTIRDGESSDIAAEQDISSTQDTSPQSATTFHPLCCSSVLVASSTGPGNDTILVFQVIEPLKSDINPGINNCPDDDNRLVMAVSHKSVTAVEKNAADHLVKLDSVHTVDVGHLVNWFEHGAGEGDSTAEQKSDDETVVGNSPKTVTRRNRERVDSDGVRAQLRASGG
jgi:hypothetical protein